MMNIYVMKQLKHVELSYIFKFDIMKKTVFLIALCSLSFMSCSQNKKKNKDKEEAKIELNNYKDSLSFTFGAAFGRNTLGQLKQSGVSMDSLDRDQMVKGFLTALDEADLPLDDAAMNQMLQAYVQKMQVLKQQESLVSAEKNKERAKAFLAENKSKDGIIETASGLQYEILTPGTGKKPSGPSTEVKVHYHGTNLDGEVFDSSVDRGQPATFALNRVIKGWTEGVQLMNQGSKYKFYIPSELAYGDMDRGEKIPGGSLLIFEVELLEVME